MRKVLSLLAAIFIFASPIFATVTDTESPVKIYTSATVTAYPIPFDYIDDEDIEVKLVNIATGAETTQTLDVDYTIVSNTVTYSSAPGSAYKVVLRRVTPFTQEGSWIAGSAPPLSAWESAFDKLTYQAQDLNERLKRSLVQPEGAANINLVLPDPTYNPGKYLKVNAEGTQYEAAELVSGSMTMNMAKLSDYASLDAMVSSIGATETTVYIDTAATLAANTTLPATMHVVMHRGGSFTLGNYNLTVNAKFEAQLFKVFNITGSGSVTGLTVARPEWWGGGATALDCAISSATTTILSPGVTYTPTSALTDISVPKQIVGDAGSRPTIAVGANMATLFSFSGNTSDLYLKDLIIDGQYASFTVSSAGIYGASAGRDLTLDNVKMTGFSHYAIDYGGKVIAGKLLFKDSDFTYNGLTGTTHNIRISGTDLKSVVFDNVTMSDGYHTILADHCADIAIIGGKYWNNAGKGPSLRDGTDSATGRAAHIRVVGATFKDNAGGYELALGINAANAAITGNTVETTGVTGNGISIDTVLTSGSAAIDAYVTVTGNTITGGAIGLRASGANYTIFGHNNIKDCATTALTATNSSNVLVDGNLFDGCTLASTGGSSNIFVTQNNVFANLATTTSPMSGMTLKPVSVFERSTSLAMAALYADVLIMDTTAGDKNIALPEASTVGLFQKITIYKKVAGNTLNVNRSGSDNLYNLSATPVTTFAITDPSDIVIMMSVGDGWTRL